MPGSRHKSTVRTLARRDGGYRCHYCGKQMTGKERRKITLDHVVPVSKDGPGIIPNFVLACTPCNTAKGAQSYEDFTGREFDGGGGACTCSWSGKNRRPTPLPCPFHRGADRDQPIGSG